MEFQKYNVKAKKKKKKNTQGQKVIKNIYMKFAVKKKKKKKLALYDQK